MILLNSTNILIIVLILLIFYLYTKNHIIENIKNKKNVKGIDSVLNISNDSNNSKMLYIFRGDKCNKYIQNNNSELLISRKYPADIQYEFKNIPSNITTSFKWSDNEIYFIKNDNAYLYDISNQRLAKKPEKSQNINKFITGDVSITPWVNNKFIAFRDNKYIIFSKGEKSSTVNTIPFL